LTRVNLRRTLSRPEHDRLRAVVADRGVLVGAQRYGLGEYLGAGPDAVAKFEHGETVCPVGHALVRAAIDWLRVGFTRAAPWSVLTAIAPAYLAGRDDVQPDREALDEGLTWATQKLNETVALLRHRADGKRSGEAFEAFEYLVDYVTRRDYPVPDEMWLLAVEAANPAESVAVGYAAYEAGRLAVAEDACRCAAYAGDTAAMQNLGVLLEQREEWEERKEREETAKAETMYRLAADDDDTRAMLCLAVLLAQRGETAEAETWLRRATQVPTT
jgi:hypothetical protein